MSILECLLSLLAMFLTQPQCGECGCCVKGSGWLWWAMIVFAGYRVSGHKPWVQEYRVSSNKPSCPQWGSSATNTVWMRSNSSKGLFTNDVSTFWGLWHPLVLMSAYHQLLACPLVLQIDDVICELPWTCSLSVHKWRSLKTPNQPFICSKREPVEPIETH